MNLAAWFLLLGALLIMMVLSHSLLERVPLTSAMLYLGLGWLLGPDVANLLQTDPTHPAPWLEALAEIALLVSLFAVGLRLEVPLNDRRWWLPIRLGTLSTLALAALVAGVGMWSLGLPLGPAVLLGAILAPTDPVLASGIRDSPPLQTDPDSRASPPVDRLGFSLAAEGGLNDGAAFPLVMLGLGLTGLHAMGPGFARWWSTDLLWAPVAGLAIGALVGAGVGRLVVYLRSRYNEAMGLDVFLSLGLISLAYGSAQLVQASGFLSVLAAGLALQRVREQPQAHTQPLEAANTPQGHSYETLAAHSHHASATMHDSVQSFNDQLEKIAELTLVLLVGAMLSYAAPLPAALWFVPLLLFVLRPLSVALAFPGERLPFSQALMLGWFGIRGIGSIFYLLFTLRHGLPEPSAQVLQALTLWTVAASIVLHGLTGQPLMQQYLRQVTRSTRSPRGERP